MSQPPQATPLRNLEVRREFANLHGKRISYLTAGEGPLLILVHGIASDAETWRTTLPLLARRFTVVAIDLPGHGSSTKAHGDYSLGSFASTVRDLMVHLGHERATLAGHSLGGGIAMQFAYMYPDRCERLALVSSGGLGREVSVLLRAATLPGSELVIGATVAPIAAVGRGISDMLRRAGLRANPDLGEVGRGFASLAHTPTRNAFLATLRSVVSANGQLVDASDRLYLAKEIPTLLVWGEHDKIIPLWHGQRAQEMMPESEIVVFAESGHFPHLDDPHRFSDSLLEFATTHRPARVTPERWSALMRERHAEQQ